MKMLTDYLNKPSIFDFIYAQYAQYAQYARRPSKEKPKLFSLSPIFA